MWNSNLFNMKRITFCILCLTSMNIIAQDSLKIEQKWSTPHELPFAMDEGVYFKEFNNNFYANFELAEEDRVFYMDVSRSAQHARFVKIDDQLHLNVVQDTSLAKQLFFKTDYSAKWSPYIDVNRGYNSVKGEDGIWTHNYKVTCTFNGETIKSNLSYKGRPDRWTGVGSSLVASENGLDAVFIGQSLIDGVFAKVFFIHFMPESKSIEIVEKEISFAELGFDSESIYPITNYADHEFRVNANPGLLFRFNLDHSTDLGISTFVFNTSSNTVEIHSTKINQKDTQLLQDFNEVEADIHVKGNKLEYFFTVRRTKMSQDGEANTNLESASGQDVFYVKYVDGKYLDMKNLPASRKTWHLLHKMKLNKTFFLFYDEKPLGQNFSKTVKIGKESEFKLWIVQFSPIETVLYEIAYDYSKLDKSIVAADLSFFENEDSTVQVIAYLSGSMFQPTRHYRVGEIVINLPK